MLGYRRSDNDIFIFFENDELLRLEKEKISGTYVNINSDKNLGKLEVSIDNNLCRTKMQKILMNIKRKSDRNISFMKLFVMDLVYYSLFERGTYESHEGFRHIHLVDSNKMDCFNTQLYMALKSFLRD